ncbi:ADP-ribosylglycohydrolase family protein [Spirillospora sp. CA-255316]
MADMTTSPPANFPQRARGAVLGAAVGDALGWPQEIRSSIVGGDKSRGISPEPHFRSWDRNSGGQYARYTERVNAGDYSDDTQLLMSVARACLSGPRWLNRLTETELPAWPVYQRGGGRAVISAARVWATGTPPWRRAASSTSRALADRAFAAYFNAGANGVAMRIAPHVIVAADLDPGSLLARITTDGITTHGHPRALVGALIHGLALRHTLLRRGTLGYGDLIQALIEDRSWQDFDRVYGTLPEDWLRAFTMSTGQPPATMWDATIGEARDLLAIAHRSLGRGALANDDDTLAEFGCFDKTRNGAGTVTAVAAAYLAARTATRPLTGLLRAAFLPKADTDTLASMTASLLGALHGPEWTGSLGRDVQDAPYLATLADRLSTAAFDPPTPSQDTTDAAIQRDPDRSPAPVRVSDIRMFRDHLPPHSDDAPRRFLDGRPVERYEHEKLKGHGAVRVDRIKMVLHDGQSLIIDSVTKIPAEGKDRPSGVPSTPTSSASRVRRPDPEPLALFAPPSDPPPPLRESFDRLRGLVSTAARIAPTLEAQPELLDLEDLHRACWVQAVAVVESWILGGVRNRRSNSMAAAREPSRERPNIRGGVFDLWPETARALGGDQQSPDVLRSRMNEIVQRRNQIVHGADRRPSGSESRAPLTAEETLSTIDWLETFAVAAWRVLADAPQEPAGASSRRRS